MLAVATHHWRSRGLSSPPVRRPCGRRLRCARRRWPPPPHPASWPCTPAGKQTDCLILTNSLGLPLCLLTSVGVSFHTTSVASSSRWHASQAHLLIRPQNHGLAQDGDQRLAREARGLIPRRQHPHLRAHREEAGSDRTFLGRSTVPSSPMWLESTYHALPAV
jgi:hypothetical protein